MFKRPQEPRMPLHADFADVDGYTDYEAYDNAMVNYEADHAAWYQEYGYILDQVEQAWLWREYQLAVADRKAA